MTRERGVPPAIRRLVLDRDKDANGWWCSICGGWFEDPALLHVDHIVPHKITKSDDPAGLQVTCARCNLIKGDRPLIRTAWVNPKWVAAS